MTLAEECRAMAALLPCAPGVAQLLERAAAALELQAGDDADAPLRAWLAIVDARPDCGPRDLALAALCRRAIMPRA